MRGSRLAGGAAAATTNPVTWVGPPPPLGIGAKGAAGRNNNGARLAHGPGSVLVESKRLYTPQAERKRFYKNVTISQGEGCKTSYYTETTLCNTALDNPSQRSKDQLIQSAVKFLETDTICYRVEEPPALEELQRNEWDPVIKWAEDRYEVVIGSSTSIMGPNIPQRTKDVFVSHLASYNSWALQGIEYMVTQLKSLILSLGLLDKHLTVEEAVLLSRLEEEYQIQHWGHVEWAHDYDMYEMRARTAAATLFVDLCSGSATVKHKLLQD
nr:ATP synthase mitochondrial F1 complex assembly factor 2 [Pogona vitticeps]